MNRHARRAAAAKTPPVKVRCDGCKQLRVSYFTRKDLPGGPHHYCEACWNGGQRDLYLEQLKDSDPQAYATYQALLLAGQAARGEGLPE